MIVGIFPTAHWHLLTLVQVRWIVSSKQPFDINTADEPLWSPLSTALPSVAVDVLLVVGRFCRWSRLLQYCNKLQNVVFIRDAPRGSRCKKRCCKEPEFLTEDMPTHFSFTQYIFYHDRCGGVTDGLFEVTSFVKEGSSYSAI